MTLFEHQCPISTDGCSSHLGSCCGFWVSWSHSSLWDTSPFWGGPGVDMKTVSVSACARPCLHPWQGLSGSRAGVPAAGDGQQPAHPPHLTLPQRADGPLTLAGQLPLPGPAGCHVPVRMATSIPPHPCGPCGSLAGRRLGTFMGCAGTPLMPIPLLCQKAARVVRCEGPTFPCP